MWSPRNGETAQAKNYKTEAVIKLQKSLNPHLLQQVGKCNLLWETAQEKIHRRRWSCFSSPWRASFPTSCFRPEYFDWQRRGYTAALASPSLPFSRGFGQVTNQADMGKEVHGVLPPPPVQRRAVQSLSSGDERNLISEEHTVHYLLVPLFILLLNSVRDFRHVVRRLVFIFSQLTKCLEVWVIWSNTPLK